MNMNQLLATKIKELPVEMISEILKHMELRFYVGVFYQRGTIPPYYRFEWFDEIEDALVMFFNG